MTHIKGEPTGGLSYNPNMPVYWEADGLKQELKRVFEICHGCRLCFNLCPSFPALFNAVDRHNGDVRGLTSEDTDRVIDTCYQCKLCYVKCPYTADDGHPFHLDFPRLLMRAMAQRRQRRGGSLRSWILSRPELTGRIGGLAAGLTNWANRNRAMRWLLELALGIHHSKQLPEFHGETFETWYRRQPLAPGDPNQAVLFYTCFVNYNRPEIGKDAIRVFAKNGIALTCPKQNCCGMPALEAGDVELAKKLAQSNVDSLYPHVRQGKKVLAINPTCSYMLRKEYPELLGTDEARQVASATRDLCEYLFSLKQAGQFCRDFLSTPATVAYHLPCHLKAQNIGFRSRDILRLIPETKVTLVDQCCGHDGTWAMKKEFFPLSKQAGKKAFEQMAAAKAEVLASDCPLAAIQFEQVLGMLPLHPIQILVKAYEPEGFARRIEPPVQGGPSDASP